VWGIVYFGALRQEIYASGAEGISSGGDSPPYSGARLPRDQCDTKNHYSIRHKLVAALNLLLLLLLFVIGCYWVAPPNLLLCPQLLLLRPLTKHQPQSGLVYLLYSIFFVAAPPIFVAAPPCQPPTPIRLIRLSLLASEARNSVGTVGLTNSNY
jgi:hypothetical protein